MIEEMISFIKENFSQENINIDDFKPELVFVDIEYSKDDSKEIVLELKEDKIGISLINKGELDFTGSDEVFQNLSDAKHYLNSLVNV